MTPTQQLQSGIQALGLDLSAEQQTQLLAYTDLLKKWNKTYNLTALRDEAQMVSHHLLDSLTLLPYLQGAHTMLDVGSGGGQPGIPTAICRPDLNITLLDANTKKPPSCNKPSSNSDSPTSASSAAASKPFKTSKPTSSPAAPSPNSPTSSTGRHIC